MRLIDADKLLERLEKKKPGAANNRYTDGFNDATMRFRFMVHGSPTVDAVPVVRCGDCRSCRVRKDIAQRFDLHWHGEKDCPYAVCQIKTNSDNIRQMTDEELADIVIRVFLYRLAATGGR